MQFFGGYARRPGIVRFQQKGNDQPNIVQPWVWPQHERIPKNISLATKINNI